MKRQIKTNESYLTNPCKMCLGAGLYPHPLQLFGVATCDRCGGAGVEPKNITPRRPKYSAFSETLKGGTKCA